MTEQEMVNRDQVIAVAVSVYSPLSSLREAAYEIEAMEDSIAKDHLLKAVDIIMATEESVKTCVRNAFSSIGYKYRAADNKTAEETDAVFLE